MFIFTKYNADIISKKKVKTISQKAIQQDQVILSFNSSPQETLFLYCSGVK